MRPDVSGYAVDALCFPVLRRWFHTFHTGDLGDFGAALWHL
jgi:hypothetical protein